MNTIRTIAALATLFLVGCASYRTPGGGVSIPELTTPSVAEALARKPAATWPARLIAVRVQGS